MIPKYDFQTNPPIEGLLRDLDQLADDLKSKAVGSGLTAAAKPLKRTLAALAPRREGLLAQSINQRRLSATAASRLQLWARDRSSRTRLEPGQVAILVGPNKRAAGGSRLRYVRRAVHLEFGTRPYRIQPRRGNVLSFGPDQVVRGAINHPGIRPRRWMSRSLEQNLGSVERLFFEGMARRLPTLQRAA